MAKKGSQSPLVSAFAQNLKLLRTTQALSQEELADRAGLDRTYVSSCERGLRNASLTSIEKLAAALKIKPRDLLDI